MHVGGRTRPHAANPIRSLSPDAAVLVHLPQEDLGAFGPGGQYGSARGGEADGVAARQGAGAFEVDAAGGDEEVDVPRVGDAHLLVGSEAGGPQGGALLADGDGGVLAAAGGD